MASPALVYHAVRSGLWRLSDGTVESEQAALGTVKKLDPGHEEFWMPRFRRFRDEISARVSRVASAELERVERLADQMSMGFDVSMKVDLATAGFWAREDFAAAEVWAWSDYQKVIC